MARVLIVDDTDIVRRALEMAVRKMGHAVVSTSDAMEALAIARKQPPDLALLDYRMPGMDGGTLFEEQAHTIQDPLANEKNFAQRRGVFAISEGDTKTPII